MYLHWLKQMIFYSIYRNIDTLVEVQLYSTASCKAKHGQQNTEKDNWIKTNDSFNSEIKFEIIFKFDNNPRINFGLT